MTRPELRIHTSRFAENIRAVRDRIAPSELMMVLKDDAYGHGLTWAVETALAAGVKWFGSYDIRSGVEARRILGGMGRVFAWATSTDAEIDDALLEGIDLGVGSADYLARVLDRSRHLGVAARVHLKIDTGLRRNGLLPQEWDATVETLRTAESEGIATFAGIWSHLAEASDAEDDDAREIYLDAVRVAESSGPTPVALHLTASAASWWRPELRGSLSRIGAFCYGIRSADGPELDGIVPVAELCAPVEEIRDGAAIVALGSFDGVPSSLAGALVGTDAGARELRRIDETTMTVEGWPGMSVGDAVVIFGDGTKGESSATTLAERIGTVGEEILTRLTPRIRRVVVD